MCTVFTYNVLNSQHTAIVYCRLDTSNTALQFPKKCQIEETFSFRAVGGKKIDNQKIETFCSVRILYPVSELCLNENYVDKK